MKFRKLGLAYLSTKGAQSLISMLNPLVKDDTTVDLARHIGEKYLLKGGSALIAAYIIDKAISYVEEFIPKKYLRGLAPLLLATFGTAAAIHYGGKYTDLTSIDMTEAAETAKKAIEEYAYIGTTYKETLMHHFHNSKQVFIDLLNLNPDYKEGCLINSLVGIFSGTRWVKNIAVSLKERAEEKKLEEEKNRQDYILNLEHAINRDIKRKKVV